MIKRPLQVGVTGGIGSGKSLICRIFACLGVPVYDADSRAKKLMTTDGILIEQIKKEFGTLSFHSDGSLNREYLTEVIFKDDDKRQLLNELVHPRVGVDYERWTRLHGEAVYVIKEAALLFEAGSNKNLDKVVTVYAPMPLRMKRILKRDPHRNIDGVKQIMDKQMAEEEKVKKADFVVLNDEVHPVLAQVLNLHSQFGRLSLHR
ncbi:MAG: dephospho-CoA kinase [Bacteroidota bacterium]